MAAGDWAAATTRARRQEGQVELERSHTSTQAVWKPWPHVGSTRTSSPSANSARQMAHSGFSPASSLSFCSGRHDTVGSDCSAFFLIPLHGAATAPGVSTEKAEGLHRREHRATMASPTTQSRKQSTAARMSSVSVCTLVPAPAMAAEAGGAASAARRSTDCCSRWRGIFLVGSRWAGQDETRAGRSLCGVGTREDWTTLWRREELGAGCCVLIVSGISSDSRWLRWRDMIHNEAHAKWEYHFRMNHSPTLKILVAWHVFIASHILSAFSCPLFLRQLGTCHLPN